MSISREENGNIIIGIQNGRYRVGESLGKGSDGQVKKIYHLDTNQTRAVKILTHTPISEDRKDQIRRRIKQKNPQLDRKMREQLITKTINAEEEKNKKIAENRAHKEAEILKHFNRGESEIISDQEGKVIQFFIVMDYIPGVGLAKFTDGKPEVCLKIAIDIAKDLETLHSFGYAHNDTKPGNMIYNPGNPENQLAKLIDFTGATKLPKNDQQLNTDENNPDDSNDDIHATNRWGYLAPERREGEQLQGTRETDIYYFGIALAEIFGFGHWEKSEYIFDEPPTDEILAKAYKIIQQMTSENPSDRSSAEQVAKQFEQLQNVLSKKPCSSNIRTTPREFTQTIAYKNLSILQEFKEARQRQLESKAQNAKTQPLAIPANIVRKIV